LQESRCSAPRSQGNCACRFGSTTAFSYSQPPLFTDVPQSNAFFPWVQKLTQLGITSSCGSTPTGVAYCPDDPVTRGPDGGFRHDFNQLLPVNTPMVVSVSPAAGPRAYTMMVTLTGQSTNWVNGTTQLSTGAGITVTNVVVTNATTLTAQLVIAANAVPGPYSPDGNYGRRIGHHSKRVHGPVGSGPAARSGSRSASPLRRIHKRQRRFAGCQLCHSHHYGGKRATLRPEYGVTNRPTVLFAVCRRNCYERLCRRPHAIRHI